MVCEKVSVKNDNKCPTDQMTAATGSKRLACGEETKYLSILSHTECQNGYRTLGVTDGSRWDEVSGLCDQPHDARPRTDRAFSEGGRRRGVKVSAYRR